jgi:hypothetical protein
MIYGGLFYFTYAVAYNFWALLISPYTINPIHHGKKKK